MQWGTLVIFIPSAQCMRLTGSKIPDCHGQDASVKIILALASGDLDSDPSFTTYWLYVLVEVIRTF